MLRPLARAITALVLLTASPAIAFRVQKLPALKGHLADASSPIVSSMAALSNGGYVVAGDFYTPPANSTVIAQVFGPGGRRVGGELRCGEASGTSRHGSVISSEHGFVLACQSFHQGSDVVSTVEFQRYDQRGRPLGSPVLLDDQLVTELVGLHKGSEGSILFRVAETECVTSDEMGGRVFDTSNRQVSTFHSQHFAIFGVLPTADGFLVASRSPTNGKARGPVYVQRLATDGTPRGPMRHLGRTGDAHIISLIPGPAGRAALTWSTRNPKSGQEFAHVLLIEASGAYDGGALRIAVPPSPNPDENAGPTLEALPLDSGFALLWTPQALVYQMPDGSDHDGYYEWEYSSLLRRYSDSGRPVGETVEIGRRSTLQPQVEFQPGTRSFLLRGVERNSVNDVRGTATLWRLDLCSPSGHLAP